MPESTAMMVVSGVRTDGTQCVLGYLTRPALAINVWFFNLPTGCLSFSCVMTSKIIPCLLLLSFPSRPYSLIMMRVLIKHEYIRSNIYLIRIPNCLLLLLLLLFSFLLFIKLLAANYYKIIIQVVDINSTIKVHFLFFRFLLLCV